MVYSLNFNTSIYGTISIPVYMDNQLLSDLLTNVHQTEDIQVHGSIPDIEC